ncbi:peptide ABC transporter substrate-binding protein [Streptomyces microflavus]|jgi:ABC-type oligopeptide transport system substrate-binding subunit|uniref:Peptide ABC transporter substrate-binding protein n=2 Tax=Streptomyces microflavus TaxID=1919 RepID=A0A7J0CWH0_STRMI|nr:MULTISPECIES: ABC transporter substrate-binding protein [Streptomyces]AGK79809.1 Family 5 extracellular solute-binding protein [Streptomyces microflavus DSM 40593]MCX4654986.1 ABC transporter substrate-binding protein [Streptomyces microflavus]MDX2408653.1 ABC transporter substrate-binding protein [Streptomyces microflavus]MDX2975442.1 ABC transporter substrate-binding protein [Streptomyces sp. NRRL_B-2249]WSA63087.1 ABC transporter substrate-binding protein [Streptomyces microflavus]
MRGSKMVGCAIVVALAATACGGGGSDEGDKSKAGGGFSMNIAEPKRLVPQSTTESGGSQVLSGLFTPLVDFDAKNQPVLAAAESIESPDNKVWTVKLKDATWHDGKPVTAKDYVGAWNWGAYGPNAADGNYFFGTIAGYDEMNPVDPDGEEGPKKAAEPKAKELSGLKAIDDKTIEITLKAPFAGYKSVLGYTVFYPMPESALADIKAYEEAPIGQGPFQMDGKWNHDKFVKVKAYKDYKLGEKPKVDSVEFRIFQDQNTAYNDLLANNLDIVDQIPTEVMGTAPSELGERFKTSTASTFQFVAFPTYDKKYSDPRIRKAISMAIDRDEIIKVVFQDSQASARSFVSPVVGGYRENTCGEACKFDPAAAKKLFTEAGGVEGNKINIGHNADGGHEQWINATCDQLKKNLGLECVSQAVPKFAELLTQVENKKFSGMFRMGWIMDYPSMENYLGPLYSTGGSSNYYGYSNKDFDRLLQEGREAKTEAEAIKKWQEAEDILAKDMPVIPLRFGKNNFGHSTNVKNVEMNLFNQVELTKVEKS